MRRALVALAATLLLAATACSAAGGGGAPKNTPANATPAPSYMPTPTGGPSQDPYYGY